MKKFTIGLLLGAVCMFSGCGEKNSAELPTEAPTVTVTVTPQELSTPEPTEIVELIVTPKPTVTPTVTPIVTPTAIPSPTVTPTAIPSPTVTLTPELMAGSVVEAVPLGIGNQAADNWWMDSELNVFINDISVNLTDGNAKMCMYIPDESLTDGEYAVELHVGPTREGRHSDTISFKVVDGKPDIADDKRYKDGYVLEFVVQYADANKWNSCGLIIKTHSSAKGPNGSIFFGNLSFEDRKNGTTQIALEADRISVYADKFMTGEKQEVYGRTSLTATKKQLLTEKMVISAPLFTTGLAISTYNNGGKAYSDWWNESEICTLIALPGEYRIGGCGATVYIPNGELKDGQYGLGIALCEDGDLNKQLVWKDISFEIKNGEYVVDNFGHSHRKTKDGYLVDLNLGYTTRAEEDNLYFCLKLHSDVVEKNGNLYFGNIYLVDELTGCEYVDLAKEKFDITSMQLRTGKKTSYQILSMADMGEDLETEAFFSDVDKYEVLTKKKGEELFPTGLAIKTDHYIGKNFGDQWWQESENQVVLTGKFDDLEARLYQGSYGFGVYIPNGYLKDGLYGVEVYLSTDRGYESSHLAGFFGVTNGVYDGEKSTLRNAVAVSDGYVVMNCGTYDQTIRSGELEILLKLHTTCTESNGELYVTDFFIADAVSGFTYVDLSKEKLEVSAKHYLTGEKENVSLYVKNFGNSIALKQYVGSLYVGEQFNLAVKSGNTGMTFTSSDKSVADITQNGVITAKKTGNTQITVKDAKSGAETSFTLKVQNSEVDVVVKKTQVVKGDTFMYDGKGLGVEETEFAWTSSNPAVGTIEKSTGKFTALKEGTTKITLKGKNSGLSYSFDVEVYAVKNGKVEDYITVVTNGLISYELERKITELLCEVYPDIFDYYADGVYSPITCNFVKMDGVAYTTGEREIYVSADYINANPKDVDCITHELIHCAQSYPSGDAWLVEGITDYGRALFGKYNADVNWKLPAYEEWHRYTDGYGTTASFLKYVVQTYNENLIEIFNEALKTGSYSPKLWVNCTGYSVDALWAKYASNILKEKPTLIYAGERISLQLTEGYDWKNISCKASETGIAEVSSNGTITGKKEGTTRITLKDADGTEAVWEITVKAPYIAPLVEKRTVAQGSVYQYVGIGYGMKNTDFSWTSSNAEVGSIDAETGLLTAVSQGSTTLTMTEKNSGKRYSFAVEVNAPKAVNPQDYVVFHSDASVPKELEERLYNLVCDVYVDVFDYFADGEYSTVFCSFGDCGGAAAYASGNQIVMDVKFITSHPNDIDSITHELIHCAQKYSTGENIWLIEGITDYGRSLFGRYNEKAGWKLMNYQPGQSYTDSYTVTGGFLKYVTEHHNENMVRILNAAFKKNEYTERIWSDNTGYTIDELWKLYSLQ